jgi:dihydrodipicolinate synthase/N-acetylneuraminate lyase
MDAAASSCWGRSARARRSDAAEKVAILKNMVKTVAGKAPVVAAISSLSTSHAVTLAKEAEQAGCSGLMVLPPYIYSTDWREMKQHVSAIIAATPLSCMLYNNPVAYTTDFLPEQIAELAQEHANSGRGEGIERGRQARRGHSRCACRSH